MNTLIDCFIGPDLSKLATITVVHVLFTYLLIKLLLLEHVLFFFDLPDDIWSFFIPTKRALDNIIIFHFMFGPLTKTF